MFANGSLYYVVCWLSEVQYLTNKDERSCSLNYLTENKLEQTKSIAFTRLKVLCSRSG